MEITLRVAGSTHELGISPCSAMVTDHTFVNKKSINHHTVALCPFSIGVLGKNDYRI